MRENRGNVNRWRFAEAVTTSDTAGDNYAVFATALHVGGAGTVSLVSAEDGTNVSFTCVAGETLSFPFLRVRITGTSATGMTALW